MPMNDIKCLNELLRFLCYLFSRLCCQTQYISSTLKPVFFRSARNWVNKMLIIWVCGHANEWYQNVWMHKLLPSSRLRRLTHISNHHHIHNRLCCLPPSAEAGSWSRGPELNSHRQKRCHCEIWQPPELRVHTTTKPTRNRRETKAKRKHKTSTKTKLHATQVLLERSVIM